MEDEMDLRFMALLDIESRWQKENPRLSDRQVYELIPEARETIEKIIAEFETEKLFLDLSFKTKLLKAQTYFDEGDRVVATECVKQSPLADRLLFLNQRLAKLKPLVYEGKPGKLNVEKARERSLVEVAEGYTTLKKVSGRFVGKCPLHNEKTPSFTIFRDNKYKCFGCGKYGDVISFISEVENKSFTEAIKVLQ